MTGPLLGGVVATFLGIKYIFILAALIVLAISIAAQRQRKFERSE